MPYLDTGEPSRGNGVFFLWSVKRVCKCFLRASNEYTGGARWPSACGVASGELRRQLDVGSKPAATSQVDLALHPSGVDRVRASSVLGIPRRETEEERLVPAAAVRPQRAADAERLHTEISCLPSPSGERPGDLPRCEPPPRNSTTQSRRAPMMGEQRESAL